MTNRRDRKDEAMTANGALEGHELSEDAKCLVACFWGSMGLTQLSFKTIARIHPRAKAALDQLVKTGHLTVEKFNRYDGLIYKPTDKTVPLGKAHMKKVGMKGLKANALPMTVD